MEHDILLAVLVLSSNSSKNEWVSTSEIFALVKTKNSEVQKRQKVVELVESKLLIEDKHRIKFYDEKVY